MRNDTTRPGLLTTREAARVLGLHPRTVERAIRRGDLPGVRIGKRGRWRVPREHVEALVHGPQGFAA